ncbi:hypothetical protein HD554DRAFT_1679592 [Boletus coccyginus]|nr:hypothetical protein HD554DRAFT_1679592 [Boletus coccyginus]
MQRAGGRRAWRTSRTLSRALIDRHKPVPIPNSFHNPLPGGRSASRTGCTLARALIDWYKFRIHSITRCPTTSLASSWCCLRLGASNSCSNKDLCHPTLGSWWLVMDPFYRPPDLFTNDSDSNSVYVPSKRPRLKRVAPLEPLEREQLVSHHQSSHHIHSEAQDVSSDIDMDSELGTDSDLTPSPMASIDARPVTDGVATVDADDDESIYQSIDEENAPD